MSEELDTEGAIMASHRPSICEKRLKELLCPFLTSVHLHSSGQLILLEKKKIIKKHFSYSKKKLIRAFFVGSTCKQMVHLSEEEWLGRCALLAFKDSLQL